MALLKDSAFIPVGDVVLIERNVGNEWKKLGLGFCDNNGWSWPGNAYLLITGNEYFEQSQIDRLESDLKEQEINLYDYVDIVNGYVTCCFGFDDYSDPRFDCYEMDLDALEICKKKMQQLGIYWCGWPQAPFFTLAGTEAQILKLIKSLDKPIAKWRKEYDFFPPDQKQT